MEIKKIPMAKKMVPLYVECHQTNDSMLWAATVDLNSCALHCLLESEKTSKQQGFILFKHEVALVTTVMLNHNP